MTRARYGGAALGLPSRASSCPCSDQPMALSARACCAGGAAAKAPTQRAARRNRRRMWCLGLRLDAQGGGGGGGGDRSYLCSTPSSCDGVECVFAFPVGAARHRARRCTQVRRRRRLQRRADGHGPRRLRLPRCSHRCRPGCGVRRRPAPAADPPGCLGGVRRWRPRFPLTSSASAAGCRVGVRSHRVLHLYPSRERLYIQNTYNILRGHTYTI